MESLVRGGTHDQAMPTRERLVQSGARRGEAIARDLGIELHEARTAAGLALAALAGAVGITRQYLARIERGSATNVPLALYARLFAVVGTRRSADADGGADPGRARRPCTGRSGPA